MDEDGPQAKRERNDDEDGEEMEIEDDDEGPKQTPASGGGESRARSIHRILNSDVQEWGDRKSTRLNSSHSGESRMPSSA